MAGNFEITSLDDLSDVSAFRWLLSDEEKESYQALIRQHLNTATPYSASTGAALVNAADAEKSRKKARKDKPKASDDDAALVRSLFV